MKRPVLVLLIALLMGPLHGCGRSTTPTWVELADASASDGSSGYGGRRAVEEPIPAAAWRASPERPGLWEVRQPLLFIGLLAGDQPPYALRAAERSYTYVPDPSRLEETAGAFCVSGGWVRLQSAEAPPDTVLALRVAHHAGSDGQRRIAGRRFSGAGCVVWPGESLELVADFAPRSMLRFATTVEAALTSKEARSATQTFRVFLDDVPIFAHHQTAAPDSFVWHAVELPRGGTRGARFRFEVEGPFAYTAFHAPLVGPGEVGAPGARPWETRPDVVVFLADTFRADNLTAYGGEHGLTPNLDAFCAEALVARRAYSVSTHTLPAHSSMFSGVFPRQNGLVDYWNPLPASIETLAEVLARHGYRTAAITDGIMVSQSHGMAQGFEWFDERGKDLDVTLERVRAVLESDDGRPLFLFVQTYATHAPYRIRAGTRERLRDRLDLGGNFDELLYSLERATPDSAVVDLERPGARATVEALRQLYLGSVADLDEAFQSFLEQLGARGLQQSGYLLFASDHGEAFCEHAELFHAGAVYEEQLRVPFVVRGPGVDAGVLEHPVSLVDFGPTVLEIARVPVPRGWLGRSVLSLDEARPLFAFQCRDALGDSTLAVVDGTQKLIGYENAERLRAGEWIGAYELDADPGEERNAWSADGWPGRSAQRFLPVLEQLMVPLVEGESMQLTADELQRIRAMGYGGE